MEYSVSENGETKTYEAKYVILARPTGGVWHIIHESEFEEELNISGYPRFLNEYNDRTHFQKEEISRPLKSFNNIEDAKSFSEKYWEKWFPNKNTETKIVLAFPIYETREILVRYKITDSEKINND